MVGKGNTRALTIHPVADDTIMRERFLAVGPCLGGIGQGVFLAFVPYENVVLGVSYCFGFQFPRMTGFAPRYRGETGDGDNNKKGTHFHSTTCNFKIREPWPDPQNTEQ